MFKSGKAIITGAQNKQQLHTCHKFIMDFIEERKEFLKIEDNNLLD